MDTVAAVFPPIVLQTCWKCLEILDAKDLPLPQLRVYNSIHRKALGSCRWSPKRPENTIIFLSKAIFSHEQTLARTVAHEMCHHVNFLRGDKDSDDHGPQFQALAAKINAVLGAKYVTDKSDEEDVIINQKWFYILVFKAGEDSYYWQNGARITEGIKKKIRGYKFHYNCKLIRTQDAKSFWLNPPNLGKDDPKKSKGWNTHPDLWSRKSTVPELKRLYDAAEPTWHEKTQAEDLKRHQDRENQSA